MPHIDKVKIPHTRVQKLNQILGLILKRIRLCGIIPNKYPTVKHVFATLNWLDLNPMSVFIPDTYALVNPILST